MVYGLDIGKLPEGWTPTEIVAVVKCVVLGDADSGPASVRYSTRSTATLSVCEAVGMLRCAEADLLAQYVGSLRPTDEL